MLPPPIIPGQTTIGVVSPASPVKDPATFTAGVDYLRSLGFTVKTIRTEFPADGYLAGTDEERVQELNAFLRDPDVQAIVCVRGGYGCLRILQDIDYDAARATPKLLVGYSDITALQLALYARAGVPSISGPMVSTEWAVLPRDDETLFFELARGHTPSPLLGPSGNALKGLKPGDATGTLLGGNLSVLVRLIGTPYLPSLEGAILFIEDIGEAAYRIDGMLAQLRLAGIWDRLGGLVLGEFTESTSTDRTSDAIMSVFDGYCQSASFPVASGLTYGHIPVKNAIPVGVRARLSVTGTHAALFIEEPVVSARAV